MFVVRLGSVDVRWPLALVLVCSRSASSRRVSRHRRRRGCTPRSRQSRDGPPTTPVARRITPDSAAPTRRRSSPGATSCATGARAAAPIPPRTSRLACRRVKPEQPVRGRGGGGRRVHSSGQRRASRHACADRDSGRADWLGRDDAAGRPGTDRAAGTRRGTAGAGWRCGAGRTRGSGPPPRPDRVGNRGEPDAGHRPDAAEAGPRRLADVPRQLRGWSYSPLKEITSRTFLELAWVWAMSEGGANQPHPLVHDGTLFLLTPTTSSRRSTPAPAT